jgi:hypothetical protein
MGDGRSYLYNSDATLTRRCIGEISAFSSERRSLRCYRSHEADASASYVWKNCYLRMYVCRKLEAESNARTVGLQAHEDPCVTVSYSTHSTIVILEKMDHSGIGKPLQVYASLRSSA